jgi:hypothetical protein
LGPSLIDGGYFAGVCAGLIIHRGAIEADDKKRFQQLMEKRMQKLDKESQKKRIAKVLKKLTQ